MKMRHMLEVPPPAKRIALAVVLAAAVATPVIAASPSSGALKMRHDGLGKGAISAAGVSVDLCRRGEPK